MLIEYNAKTGKNIEFSHENIRRIYKEEGGENIAVFTDRIIPAYEDILEKYRGVSACAYPSSYDVMIG